MDDSLVLNDSAVSYNSMDDARMINLIDSIRKGISFHVFLSLVSQSPFSIIEWSSFLHLSERTLQRYRKEEKRFDPIHSEKIMEITMLYNLGTEIFGDKTRFDAWLGSENIALGGSKPKTFLDNTFGIGLLKDELIRIEHGVLA
jgi:putative toxin-antitoxin system antitoxin component (TIGR02293 family)